MVSDTTQPAEFISVQDGCYSLVIVFSLFLFISIFVYILNLIFDLDEEKSDNFDYVRYGTLGDGYDGWEK